METNSRGTSLKSKNLGGLVCAQIFHVVRHKNNTVCGGIRMAPCSS